MHPNPPSLNPELRVSRFCIHLNAQLSGCGLHQGASGGEELGGLGSVALLAPHPLRCARRLEPWDKRGEGLKEVYIERKGGKVKSGLDRTKGWKDFEWLRKVSRGLNKCSVALLAPHLPRRSRRLQPWRERDLLSDIIVMIRWTGLALWAALLAPHALRRSRRLEPCPYSE